MKESFSHSFLPSCIQRLSSPSLTLLEVTDEALPCVRTLLFGIWSYLNLHAVLWLKSALSRSTEARRFICAAGGLRG